MLVLKNVAVTYGLNDEKNQDVIKIKTLIEPIFS
jgi:hypothetical protein